MDEQPDMLKSNRHLETLRTPMAPRCLPQGAISAFRAEWTGASRLEPRMCGLIAPDT
jgi:hypothetical protein